MDIALFLVQPLTIIMKNMNQLTEAQYPAKTLDSGFHVNQTIYPNNLTLPHPQANRIMCDSTSQLEEHVHLAWKCPRFTSDKGSAMFETWSKSVSHEAQEQDSHQNIGLLVTHQISILFCSIFCCVCRFWVIQERWMLSRPAWRRSSWPTTPPRFCTTPCL